MSADRPDVPSRLQDAIVTWWSRLAEPGTWWTGSDRVDLARVARAAFSERTEPSWIREQTMEAIAHSGLDVEVCRTMATLAADAHRIDADWAGHATALVGDGRYVEMVAIAATVAAVDAFSVALGTELEHLPEPVPGRPSLIRPDGMGNIGAFVPMADPWADANVARALTLSPTGNAMYRGIAVALYHDGHFLDLEWDRPISRPQAELLATTVSVANECFY